MSDALNSAVRSLVSLIDGATADSVKRFRALHQVQVATLRLMVLAKLVTVDEAVAEIEAVGKEYPQIFRLEGVSEGVAWAIDLLRGEVPLHGSIINMRMQMMDRARRDSERTEAL